MSLADYVPERDTVKIGKGGSFTVRGLSVDDVSSLLRNHLVDIDKLFTLYAAKNKDVFADDAAKKLIMTTLGDFPHVASALIALSADEPGMEAKVRTLPFPTQFEALQKIGRLTFEEVGGAKNFIANLMMLVEGLSPPSAKQVRESKKIAS